MLLAVIAGASVLSYDRPGLEAGTIESPARGETIVTSQGWHELGYDDPNKPARLTSIGPNGTVEWTEGLPVPSSTGFYDVDPLSNGNLLVVSPVPGDTLVYEVDPETGERVWTERFDTADVHDVDRIGENQLLVADIRYTSQNGTSPDGVFVYDRSRDEITWEWRFRDHYPADAGPGAGATDWTHVNDVDEVRPGEYLVSPRNLDQVILINRSTGAIDWRLGADGDHDTLYEQHNPAYLDGRNGTPTVLVADSENDRVVEYARLNGSWKQIWAIESERLNWPRDADRLPNGNTLITDSMNHRVIEVTPKGRVVWEFYAPWVTYDAERRPYGDEAGGPTMREMNVSGTYELSGSSDPGSTDPWVGVSTAVKDAAAGTPVAPQVNRGLDRVKHVGPWITPVWMPTITLVPLAALLFVLGVWGGWGVLRCLSGLVDRP